MTYRFIFDVRWSCDGDKCTASVVGFSDALPDGWSAKVVDARLDHYCPECAKKLAAPEAKH